MSKVSAMKNTKQVKLNKTENFPTHKNTRDYGHNAARNEKQGNKYKAWEGE